MFVSSRPCAGSSAVIGTPGLVSRRILISSEAIQVDRSSAARHRGKFRTGDKPATLPQRYEFADSVTVASDCECLTTLYGIHDLLRPCSQIALSDLRLHAHEQDGSTCCYHVLPL